MASLKNSDTILSDLKVQLKKAKVDVKALSTLAQQGDEKFVEKFIRESLSIPTSDFEALSSQLYIACFWGFKQIVEAVIAKNVNIDNQNKGTLWTPLHAACFQEHGPIVMVLLNKGAQPELPDSEGRTAKDFASISPKIWPLFAALNFKPTPRSKLMKLGIIKSDNDSHDLPKALTSGIKMADRQCELPTGDGNAALGVAQDGDVLANSKEAQKRSQITLQALR
ncbi:DgyrCDS6143 [Dimorphilus gyrociliatus]|uniref:DgyrCDS6143 n=1 Tax=Dimorphilus gyrociliatus TaxID=2664684 RepID=A0A7I8VM49_9ANNE|nr:DgyrCDS6143 [Dimorphilus gyrociliatus]